MKVQGKIILTRKNLLIAKFGVEAWARFFSELTRELPALSAPITANSLIPLHTFLAFHDALMRRFFDVSDAAHVALGRESARWAVRQGLCPVLANRTDVSAFVEQMPSFWSTYFAETTSHCELWLDESGVHFRVLDLPMRHPYLEHVIVGYVSEVMDTFCANPISATLVEHGAHDYHYVLATAASPRLAEHSAGAGDGQQEVGSPPLSQREGEVLRFVARGKTNKQIAEALGISPKTVQHHATRAYAKVGVSGRVDAVRWMAKRGMLSEER